MEAEFVEEYLRQLALTTSGEAEVDYGVTVTFASEAVRDCYRFLTLSDKTYVEEAIRHAPMHDYRVDSLAHDFALYRQTGAGFAPEEVGAEASEKFRAIVDEHFPRLALAMNGRTLYRKRGG